MSHRFGTIFGQNAFENVLHIGIGLTSGALILSNSFLLPWFMDQRVLRRRGKRCELDSVMNDLAERTMKIVKVKEKRKPLAKFYFTRGNLPEYYGSFYLEVGTFIGIPYWFKYRTKDDINLKEVGFETRSDIDWNSDAGKLFLTTLVVSDSAKMFALVKEAYAADSGSFFITSFIPMVAGYTPTLIVSDLIKKLDPALSATNRLIILLLTAGVAVILYLFLSAFARERIDFYAANRACHIDMKITEGGVEYYKKLIARNKALRVLLGKEGRDRYTEGGDIIYPLTKERAGLTDLQEFVEKKLKAMKEVENEST